MQKNVYGKKLSRTIDQRKALFKQLATSLIAHGRIQTTEAKAKAVRGLIDKLVNWAKDGETHHRFLRMFLSKDTVKKLVDEVLPGFTTRRSGFTRIIKVGSRLGDSAPMVLMEWVEGIEKSKLKIENKVEKKKVTGSRAKKKTGTTETQKKK